MGLLCLVGVVAADRVHGLDRPRLVRLDDFGVVQMNFVNRVSGTVSVVVSLEGSFRTFHLYHLQKPFPPSAPQYHVAQILKIVHHGCDHQS